jgi:hypothetical protein
MDIIETTRTKIAIEPNSGTVLFPDVVMLSDVVVLSYVVMLSVGNPRSGGFPLLIESIPVLLSCGIGPGLVSLTLLPFVILSCGTGPEDAP